MFHIPSPTPQETRFSNSKPGSRATPKSAFKTPADPTKFNGVLSVKVSARPRKQSLQPLPSPANPLIQTHLNWILSAATIAVRARRARENFILKYQPVSNLQNSSSSHLDSSKISVNKPRIDSHAFPNPLSLLPSPPLTTLPW